MSCFSYLTDKLSHTLLAKVYKPPNSLLTMIVLPGASRTRHLGRSWALFHFLLKFNVWSSPFRLHKHGLVFTEKKLFKTDEHSLSTCSMKFIQISFNFMENESRPWISWSRTLHFYDSTRSSNCEQKLIANYFFMKTKKWIFYSKRLRNKWSPVNLQQTG